MKSLESSFFFSSDHGGGVNGNVGEKRYLYSKENG